MKPENEPHNKMTPETITVSKIEDLQELLQAALAETETILERIDTGDVSPEESSAIINEKLDAIFTTKATSGEILEFLLNKIPARCLEDVFNGIWRTTQNLH